jgi:hypothetical protein
MPSTEMRPSSTALPPAMPFAMFAPAMEYMVDAAQRSVLFWDVMRQRGNQYHEHAAEKVPNVLSYKAELVVDGRTLPRPVNYVLARIIPPAGTRSIRRAGPSSSSIRAPVTARGSAASRPTARSASRSRPATPAISSASFPSRCRARPSRTSPAPRRPLSRR